MTADVKTTKLTGAENVRWNLKDLFSGVDDPRIEKTLAKGLENVTEFKNKYKGKLSQLSAAGLEAAYRELINLTSPVYRVSQFASLVISVDNSSESAKALQARTQEIGSKISNELVFFSIELGDMDAGDFKKFEDAPELIDFSYNLKRTRETSKYNLTEKEEQISNLKNLTGSSAFTRLYAELTSAFKFDFEINGDTKTYSGAELRALRQHPDADVRRRAMKLFFDKHEENQIILTHAYNNVIKDFNIMKDLRGYESPISVMNIGNDLDNESVAALIQTTTASNKLVQRYYKIKAKILDLPDLTLADIYAPLPESDKTYSWDEAKDLVLDAFNSFDADFYKNAKTMFDDNRIDAPVVQNKRGGAYCSYATPDLNPYVFLNFTGKVRDVATMAHELGHAIHGFLSQGQHLYNFHPILPLAETASVFSEMVLTDKFLKQESDDSVKVNLLTSKLEDIFATSHRQNMFSRFELAAHDTISKRLMSAEDFCNLYRDELKIMFGDSVKYTDEYNWEWSSIPHIINVPFYVYAYNFANLLVLALYQQYLEEGQAFIPKFKHFLSMGSSARPVEIAAQVGQDIADPNFWNQGFRYIEGLIDQLEALIK